MSTLKTDATYYEGGTGELPRSDVILGEIKKDDYGVPILETITVTPAVYMSEAPPKSMDSGKHCLHCKYGGEGCRAAVVLGVGATEEILAYFLRAKVDNGVPTKLDEACPRFAAKQSTQQRSER